MSQINSSSLWQPPPTFHSNGQLDKSSLDREFEFPILKVSTNAFPNAIKILKRFSPDLTNFKNIIEHDSEWKGIVLDPTIKFVDIENRLCETERKGLANLHVKLDPDQLEYRSIRVSYDNYKLPTLMQWILPENVRVTAFTLVGHIAHLNLKHESEPHKFAIGQLILDKVSQVKCVVTKTKSIDNEYRTFELELIAGESDYVTTVKETGCRFRMDFSRVYWNSRLSNEHERIVHELQSSDVLYDACAGIGPFAIPAAKKGCKVVANDLNKESCHWLAENVTLNSSRRKKISVDLHNLDAGEFIRTIVLPDINTRLTNPAIQCGRFYLVMNLPAIAVEFLSSIVDTHQIQSIDAVLHVRCYCFIGTKSPRESIEQRIHEQLGDRINKLELRFVRNVAPSKDMYCAQIEVRLATPNDSDDHIAHKRIKIDSNNLDQ